MVYKNLAKRRMQRSGLAFNVNFTQEEKDAQASVRTSDGAFISYDEDLTGIIRKAERRIALLTGIPRDNGESWNGTWAPTVECSCARRPSPSP